MHHWRGLPGLTMSSKMGHSHSPISAFFFWDPVKNSRAVLVALPGGLQMYRVPRCSFLGIVHTRTQDNTEVGRRLLHCIALVNTHCWWR